MTEAGCTHTQCVRTIHMTEYRLERNSCASHVEEEKTVFCERWYALSYCIILHGIVLYCMELYFILIIFIFVNDIFSRGKSFLPF